MTKTTKLKEAICYEENDIKIFLEVDYVYNKISLIELAGIRDGKAEHRPKNYLFAGRGIGHMNGWLNILQTMQNAIKLGKTMYEKELAAESSFKGKRIEKIICTQKKK